MSKYYKLFNEQENHHGFQYQDGLNTDTLPFNSNPEDSCVEGGLYFSDAENIMNFLCNDPPYEYIREVEVPEGELIIKDPDTDSTKWRAHSLYLHKRRSLYEAETWKWLKEQNVNFDVVDRFNNTALILAVYFSHNKYEKLVKLLIDSGANLDIQDDRGKTALYWAACRNQPIMAEMLIKAGANFDVANSNNVTALMCAVYHGNTKIVQLLVKAGANLDIQNNIYGDTALIIVASNMAGWVHNSSKILKMLLDAGANTEIKNNEGKTYKDYLLEETTA